MAFDGRKRQKGGILNILGTLAKPLLVSAGGAVGGEVLKGIRKKYFWEKNVVEKQEKDINMPRNNILLRKLPNPWRIQLPNSRIFFAKYKRGNRHALALTQVRIARTYVRKTEMARQRIRQFGSRNKRKRRQQAGVGLHIATAIDLGKRAAGSKLDKMMINDYIPTAYKKIKNKITNKKVKAVRTEMWTIIL